MVKNVGGVDRVLRVAAGIVLLLLVFIGPKTPWGWIGLVLLLTGLFNFCPAYLALRINTFKKKQS
jgi:hypothetical protein